MQEREKLQGIYEGEDPLKKSRAIRGGLRVYLVEEEPERDGVYRSI